MGKKGSYAGGSTIINSDFTWASDDQAEDRTNKIGSLKPSERDLALGERLKKLQASGAKPEFGNAARIFSRDEVRKSAAKSKPQPKPPVARARAITPTAALTTDVDRAQSESRALIQQVFRAPSKGRKNYPGRKP